MSSFAEAGVVLEEDPTYEGLTFVDDPEVSPRRRLPAAVQIMSKLERSAGQHRRWERVAKRILRRMVEEYGESPFSIKDARECGWLDRERVSAVRLMRLLIVRGWYQYDQRSFTLTFAGQQAYENLYAVEPYPEEVEE